MLQYIGSDVTIHWSWCYLILALVFPYIGPAGVTYIGPGVTALDLVLPCIGLGVTT